jgi:hypothetical protein
MGREKKISDPRIKVKKQISSFQSLYSSFFFKLGVTSYICTVTVTEFRQSSSFN